MKANYLWIDFLKGVGIISVVIGHIFYTPYIYAFHMPLFFILGGFLCSKKNIKEFFIKKIKHLIIPYLAFLVLFSIPDLIKYIIVDDYSSIKNGMINSLWGGVKLHGTRGVFWFVSVYFITQQLFNIYLSYKINIRYVLLLIPIAYFLSASHIELPLNAQVVPMAFIFWTIGYLLKSVHITKYKSKLYIMISIIYLVGIYPVSKYITWNMKHTEYNIPIIGIVTASLFFISLSIISYVLCSRFSSNQFNKHIAYIGTASMSIMFIHQFVHFLLKIYLDMNLILVCILSIYIPLLLYFFLGKSSCSTIKLLFLGK